MVKEHLKTCLSLFLKNFCMFFALCLVRFVPSPSPGIFYVTRYLRLVSTDFFSCNYFRSCHKGLPIAAVYSVFMGHISIALS